MDAITQILFSPPDSSLIYVASYDPFWISISVLLSILACYAALNASSRIKDQQSPLSRLAWIMISSLTLGSGIWAMHFIGMLALILPCKIYYDPLTTMISMAPAILASGAALNLIGCPESKRWPPVTCSILLGAGISGMHYIGMTAMHLEGFVRYNPYRFAASILIAVVLSYLALTLKDRIFFQKKHGDLLVSAIMGLAISAMHYTAMSAAYFVHDKAIIAASADFSANSAAILVALTTIYITIFVLVLAAVSRNREITGELRSSQERWQFALEGAGDGVWDWNIQTDEVFFSKQWKKMIGYAENEFPEKSAAWLENIHPNDKDSVLSTLSKYLAEKLPNYSIEFRMRCKDGSWKWILTRGKMISRDAEGKPQRIIGVHSDISERKKAELELKIAASAFESQEGIMITDADNVILRVNRAFTKITGYTAEDAIGNSPRILSSGRQNSEFYKAMWQNIYNTGEWAGEIWNRNKQGDIFLEHLKITAVKNEEGSISHYVGTLADITMSQAAADEIQRLAFYDPLTSLPNRRLLQDRINSAIISCKRSGRNGALLFIDMDHFKIINDTLGHKMGDMLLQQVAKRLSSCVREDDTVARFGGDEFVVMLENLSRHTKEAMAQAETIGAKIISELNHSYQLITQEYACTPSIGAVLFSDNEHNVDELMKQADIAMYQAKTDGRNILRFFDPKMQASMNTRLELEKDLRSAQSENQFELYYQPQIFGNHLIVGAEVLIRWRHPLRGMVPPMHFIPLAEETGLILPIGQWVLETACSQIKRWADFPVMRKIQLAVNVSARQFHQPDFVEQVRQALQRHAISADNLKLELTETLVLNDLDDTIRKMSALRDIGIHFSMDDFGTGYSSLSSLKKLPLDQLKIDQSFVRDIASDPDDAVIVQTIIAMANKLGMDVIAEGVETEEQLMLLKQYGCLLYQGYLFGKPMPLADFEQLLGEKELKFA